MLKFMRVKGNGENFKDGEIVIFNTDNQEIIPANLFVHKRAEPNIELVPYEIKESKCQEND